MAQLYSLLENSVDSLSNLISLCYVASVWDIARLHVLANILPVFLILQTIVIKDLCTTSNRV